jgi:membrane associated rhomboid family serine protease
MIPYSAMENDEPLQIFPWMNYVLIAVNFLVFFYELALGAHGSGPLNTFILDYGLVPCEYTGHCVAYAGTPTPLWITLFTSMFMHAGWAHILGNMIFLWVFGGHIERSMGHLRYLVFYLLCGLAANALEIATAATSNNPGLGASGAIAGVLGAYLVLYPSSRVGTLLPLSIILIPVRLPAWVLIGGWFLLQLIDGVSSLSPNAGGAATGGVAYWAHVGGFLAGVVLIWLFRQPQQVSRLQTYHSQGDWRGAA